MIEYDSMGKRIRAARIERGYTQEQLAEMVNAGTTHISHIETGNTIPSMKLFVNLANALEVSADALLCDSLVSAKEVFVQEIHKSIQDCSEEEIRIIADMIWALKDSLRKRKMVRR